MSFKILSDINNLPLVQLEVRSLLNTQFKDVYENGEVFNFRCNVCGDSETRSNIKRGYILKNRTPWQYFCHNCGYSASVLSWMRKYYPIEYKILHGKVMLGRENFSDDVGKIQTNKPKDKEFDEKDVIKHFKKIADFPFAVEYCEKRKIPNEIYEKWFYDESGYYKNRIIIPFYDKDGKIYYYQGRAIHNWMTPKYNSRKGNRNSIYNYYNVDKEKYVTVLEGPIDSMFVENSVALTGLNKNAKQYLDKIPLKRYMFDNDKPGRKESLIRLNDGDYVFNWQLFLKEYDCGVNVKDVNDFILNNEKGITKLTMDLIDPYFTNKYGDSIYFA